MESEPKELSSERKAQPALRKAIPSGHSRALVDILGEVGPPHAVEIISQAEQECSANLRVKLRPERERRVCA